MKRILISLSVIAFVGALAAGATGAFFTDTETSTGNTFTAGSIDLKIDNECHYWNYVGGSQNTGGGPGYVDVGCTDKQGVTWGTWGEDDLGAIRKFFSFWDLKPGDWGEDTISLHVYDNDAWGLWSLVKSTDSEGTCVEPETEAQAQAEGHPCVEGTTPGQLGDHMTGMAWLDQGSVPGFQCKTTPHCGGDRWEGNNVWDDPQLEPVIAQNVDTAGNRIGSFFDVFVDIDLSKPLKAARAAAGEACEGAPTDGHTAPIGEPYLACHGLAVDGRLVGSTTYYVGWMWKLDPNTGNEAQTDMLGGDMMFKVEQHRNNPRPSWLPA